MLGSSTGQGAQAGKKAGKKAGKGRKVKSLLPRHQSHSSLEMKVHCSVSVVLKHAHKFPQTEVRKFAMVLLKRKSKESPFHLPSAAEFKLFETRKIGGPTKKNFRVQLKGSLACRWNRCAANIFSRAYIKKNGNQFKHEALTACFNTHLRTLRNQHNRIKAGPTKTQADIEHYSTSARRTRRQGVRKLQI